MMNSPFYQKINIEKAEGKDKEHLVRLAYLREKVAKAEDQKSRFEHAVGRVERLVADFEEKLNDVVEHNKVGGSAAEQAVTQLQEGVVKDFKAAQQQADADLLRGQMSLSRLEEGLKDKITLRTESFELKYHNQKWGEVSDLWKTQDAFYEFIEEKVDAFNAQFEREVIVCRAFSDEATVHFLFPKSHLVDVEAFIPEMVNAVRTDYEQNYIQANWPDDNRVEYYQKEDSTEHPFSLHGTGASNLFYFYSRHELVGKNRDQVLAESKSKYGTPDDDRLLDYQSMLPHFVLPESDPIAQDINAWREQCFGAKIGDTHINRDRAGFDRVSRLTQQRVLEVYPEIVAKFEKEDQQRTQDAEAFVYD